MIVDEDVAFNQLALGNAEQLEFVSVVETLSQLREDESVVAMRNFAGYSYWRTVATGK